jgi:hypothetical protein
LLTIFFQELFKLYRDNQLSVANDELFQVVSIFVPTLLLVKMLHCNAMN